MPENMSPAPRCLGKLVGDAKREIEAAQAKRDRDEPGWREREANEQTVRAEADRRIRRIALLNEADVRLSPRSRNAIVDGTERSTSAMREVRKWVAQELRRRPVLALLGGTGCGKTTAAAWLLVGACLRPQGNPTFPSGGRALAGEELTRLAHSSWSDDVELLRRIMSSPHPLLVDDLGAEGDAERASRGLYAVVNARQALPTVITSNLSPGDFGKFCGPRTLSRLHEVGRIVWCDGADLRRTA